MLELMSHYKKQMAGAINWFAKNKSDLHSILKESVLSTLDLEATGVWAMNV